MNKALYSSIFILVILLSFVSAATFKESSNSFLSQETGDKIDVFNYKLFKAVFFDINETIVLYVLFFVVFFVLLSVMSLVPFFENKAVAFLVSLIVSLLIALTGVYSEITMFLFNSVANFTKGWSLIAMAIIIAVLVGAGIMLKEVVYFFKKTGDKSKAKYSGFRLALDNTMNNLRRKYSDD